MGFWDSAKKIFAVTDSEEYEETWEEQEEIAEEEAETEKSTFMGGLFSSRGAARTTEAAGSSQMQVVLVKPERFDDGIGIADHLNQNKTVVLNLENADRETCRRLLDFLSGAAYIRKGNIKKVARSTYIITPSQVNVMGEVLSEDFDATSMYL